MSRLRWTLGVALWLAVCGCRQEAASPAPAKSESSAAETAPAGTDVDLGPASGTEAAPANAEATPPASAAATEPAPPVGPQGVPSATAAAPSVAAPSVPVAPSAVELNHISDEGALAIVLRPAKALKNPVVAGVLQEMEAANPKFKLEEKLQEMRDMLGIDVNDMEHVLVVLDKQHLEMIPVFAGMFMGGGMGPGGPPGFDQGVEADPGTNCDDLFAPTENGPQGDFGPDPSAMPTPTVVIKFTREVDGKKLAAAGGSSPEERTHNGKTYYFKQSDQSAAWFRDAGTAIMAPEAKVKSLIDGQTPAAGPLAKQMEPLAGREFALGLDVRPLHGFIGQLAQENPAMALAGGYVKQVNTLALAADLEGASLLELQLHAISDGSAMGLQAMLGQLLQQGQMMYAQQMQQAAEAMTADDKALVPLVEQLVNGAQVSADGNLCRVTVPRPEGIEKLPELIRPQLKKAAQAAGSARILNDLKMIGIAFHNYHDSHRSFPAHGGMGDPQAPGKGLSWRVHLLPFLEEFPLHQEFHLDEPWDSEHNKSLIPRMPAIYGSDPEGKSSIHVFTGPGTPFDGDAGVKLQQVTDGTSNTILVVQAGPSTADIWTKPGGLPLNADNPITALGDVGETFPVIFMDAAARLLSSNIDPATLKNLIQPNDGNPVQLD